jgi:diaminopimelate decarboxylase
MRKDQILDAYTRLRDMWVQRFGLHAMLVSNERDEEKLIENARILFTLAYEIHIHTGIQMEWINLWGGIWVAYHPDHHEVDLDIFARGVRTCYDDIIVANNLWNPKIYMENGRYITAAAGCIVTRVTNIAEKHLTFVGLDASMADLMRPGMYTTKNPDGTWDQCYHHFTVIWKGHLPADTRYNVTGSLCENNDQFSRGVILPRVDIGDIVCIHTTGAHGQSMGFNYNGKLHSAEILMNRDNSMKKIRRAQTYDDLFIDIL